MLSKATKKTNTNILSQYKEVRSYTEELCKPLNTEDFIPQPVAYASPPKWHIAHTSWFFEELFLKKYMPGYKEYHPQFSFLFNSYYNALGNRIMRENRGSITRPTVKQVYAYRAYIDEQVEAFLTDVPLSTEAEYMLTLGLNHEQQHQELLITDLKHTLGHNPIFPIYKPNYFSSEQLNLQTGWLDIEEGVYSIGYEGDGFCYDNELGRHKRYVHGCKVSKQLITNIEFLEFMSEGGYENPSYWHDEGWTWVQKEGVKSPLYWHNIEGNWHCYTLGGLKKVPENSILSHVNFYEACAFAEWKGKRLLTEVEWEVAADSLDWGSRWEWTNSAYLPYPKFTKEEGAIGEYNGKFMVNQMVLRGASIATSPNHSRKTYRNFFHPQYRWQFTGIRLAENL